VIRALLVAAALVVALVLGASLVVTESLSGNIVRCGIAF
jgi:hypothetical protein